VLQNGSLISIHRRDRAHHISYGIGKIQCISSFILSCEGECNYVSNCTNFIILQDGVILGADTRATEDTIVADKNCSKIHYIADNI